MRQWAIIGDFIAMFYNIVTTLHFPFPYQSRMCRLVPNYNNFLYHFK